MISLLVCAIAAVEAYGKNVQDAEWSELQAKLTNYESVYDEPIPSLVNVNTIPDAPICGGGKLTVAVDGTHREVNYHLSKSDFWAVVFHHGRLFQQYHIRNLPLGKIALSVHNAAAKAKGFQHVQDMATAEVRSELPLTGGSLSVRCVALAQRDMVVYELEAKGTSASLTVRLDTENEHNNFFIIKGSHDERTVWFRKEHTSFITVNAAAAMRVTGAENVRIPYEQGFPSALTFDVKPGQTTRLLVSVKGGKDEYKHLEEALVALDVASDGNAVAVMLAEHAQWWKAYWLKSWVNLNNSLLERYYYGALYVLGSSIDLDARATPGLAGGWLTTPNPIWGGSYTMNYNGEAPFWGLFSSNRGEFILPYARVLEDYIPTGRALAKRLHTKGIVLPVMIGPWGIEDNDDDLGQKSNASLAALSLIWHYRFSKDREFLETYAYPYLRELMEYWEDNLELDDTGRYVIKGAARERDRGDLNPGPTLAYVRQVLRAAIDFSTELGLDKDRRGKWQDYLDRLSDYPVMVINGNMCFTEAENRMEVGSMGEEVGELGMGDNPVVLDSVYPGGSLDEDNPDSVRGRIIARNTLRFMQSWYQGNGFPRIFSQAVRAEYPGEELLQIFTKRINRGIMAKKHGTGMHEKVRRNNTILPEDHSFEGVGSIEFLNSMLAQAHGGVIKVFNVWPEERDASFKRLRVRGAFLVSGELKHGKVSGVEILSEQGGKCLMQSCWPRQSIIVKKTDGQSVKISSKAGVYEWDTIPGAVYLITSGESVAAEKNTPALLVPLVDSAAAQGLKYCDATLDVLLTPDVQSTQLQVDMLRVDETRSRATHKCSFTSRDKKVATVDSKGVIRAVGRGWTTVDIEAKIDGVCLKSSVRVYALTVNVIPSVKADAPHTKTRRGNLNWSNGPELLVGVGGIDGPDVTSLHRSNSYRVGLYAMDKGGKEGTLIFDFGKEYKLDEMYIWNYNSPNKYRVLWWTGGPACGMRDVTIEYSENGKKWEELKSEGYPFRLAKATGKQWMPATNLDDGKSSPISFNGVKARYVRLAPNAAVGKGNWGGNKFGLSEVRFTYK